MIYAPVVIPTLNRFKHLKQCVDSLNMNHNADKTEVYISVDYPPSEKYIEGHDKICEYLENSHFNFKKLHLIKQKENLGVSNGGKKYSNSSFLRELVTQKYDRWIFSEDDNIFAPGFLDFMNEALEKFKDDKSVFAICGYRFYYNLKSEGNNYLRQNCDFNAWGVGRWTSKYEEVMRLDVNYLIKMLHNPFRVLRLWRVSNNRVTSLCGLSMKKNFKRGDNFYTLYMIDNGMTQIMPAKSLVRNIGWDESGMHCVGFSDEVSKSHLCQEIDESPEFEGLKGTGWECFKENQKIIRDSDFQKVSFWAALTTYLYRIFRYKETD